MVIRDVSEKLWTIVSIDMELAESHHRERRLTYIRAP